MTKEANKKTKTKGKDMKKYFLTTALMGTFIAPAFGADKIITSANTCTVDVLGVSDNNATANTIATWDLIDYTLDPGEYLNVTDTSVTETTCPAGSYCVGGGFTVETANNSIAQCPTGYPNSANGASADTQCYTACTVATANIAHATAVSGNDYYGTGTDTCGATACETGYHVDGGVTIVEQTPLIPVNYETEGNGYTYIDQSGIAHIDASAAGLTTNNTWATDFDYGVVYGRASCQPSTDPAFVYVMNNMEAVSSGSKTMDELRTELTTQYGQTKANLLMDYLELEMSGAEDVYTNEANFETFAKYFVTLSESSDKNYTTDSTGQYCYCQMDGFSPITEGVLGEKTSVTSAPWVFLRDFGSAGDCASFCANDCAYDLRYVDVDLRAFRAVVFGVFEAKISATCTANTINIDWNPDNNGAHTINQCTYDGSITVPSDPVKPGYTFMGWKLLEKSTTTE